MFHFHHNFSRKIKPQALHPNPSRISKPILETVVSQNLRKKSYLCVHNSGDGFSLSRGRGRPAGWLAAGFCARARVTRDAAAGSSVREMSGEVLGTRLKPVPVLSFRPLTSHERRNRGSVIGSADLLLYAATPSGGRARRARRSSSKPPALRAKTKPAGRGGSR